ncbi:phosphatase PAP2 family protein [Leifsonia sp. NPDC058230]|uniref:phosphatase PAP2 family protein n=1 Tax=Leifsonia sp. NPDC058230 TaxID=3346391 RepID=UPI0036DEEAB5
MLASSLRTPRAQTPTPVAVVQVAASGAVIVVVILAGLVIRVTSGATLVDLRVLNAFAAIQNTALTAIAFGVDWVFSPPIAAVIVVLAGAGVWIVTRRLRAVVLFVGVAVLPWLGSEVVKLIVRRPRPDPASLAHPLLASPPSFSFPSGHTCFALALCLALLTVAWSTRARPFLIAISVVIPVTTGLSRIYLGVHYPTDVLASLAYTAAAAAAVTVLGRMILARVDRHGE